MLRWAAVLLAGIAAPALAHEDVRYGAAPEWVLPAPAFAQPERQQGAFALLYRDTQVLRDDAGTHMFEAWRTRIQTAEALALGSIGLVWNPAAGGPTVHGLKVIRDGEAIDVLESARFATFQREGGPWLAGRQLRLHEPAIGPGRAAGALAWAHRHRRSARAL